MFSKKLLTEIEQVIDEPGKRAKVIKFNFGRGISERDVVQVESEICRYFDEDSSADYCLNFSDMESLPAAVLGSLITFDKKHRVARGRGLSLARVRPEIYEILAITRLDKVFKMYNTLEDFYDSLEEKPEKQEASGLEKTADETEKKVVNVKSAVEDSAETFVEKSYHEKLVNDGYVVKRIFYKDADKLQESVNSGVLEKILIIHGSEVPEVKPELMDESLFEDCYVKYVKGEGWGV